MRKVTGVAFSGAWTWHIVRSLGFTPQKPQVRSVKRDEAAIAAWKEKRLPGLKKMGGTVWIFSGLRG
jgi:transposase